MITPRKTARAAEDFLDRLLREEMPHEPSVERDIYVLAPRLLERHTPRALAGALAAALVELRRRRSEVFGDEPL